MSRLAGRTRMATKWLVMAAVGLPLVALVPCRQVTCWIVSARAMASWRRFTGGRGEAGLRGEPRPPPRGAGVRAPRARPGPRGALARAALHPPPRARTQPRAL